MAFDKEQDQSIEMAEDGQQNGAHESLPAADAQELAQESQGGVSRQEYERVSQERDALLNRLARLQAEFDNYRKRAARENIDFREYALADAARSMLPVIDNLALALKNASASPDDFRKGVELIARQLQAALEKMNVQRVPAQGEPFDPRVHEAIEVVESDQVPDHHVLEELQAGYKMKDRLLRPAMVKVAKKPE